MGGQLVTFVDVVDDDGQSHCFAPGQRPPAWATDKISNPDVWADGLGVGVLPAPPSADGGDDGTGTGPDDDFDDHGEDDHHDDGDGFPPLPPIEGTGSGITAWRKAAAARGVNTTGLNLDEIRDAVTAFEAQQD